LFGSTVVVGQVASGLGNLFINSDGDIEGRINTTVRWHLDSDGSGWLGNASNFYWDTDGTPHFGISGLIGATAGDNLLISADTEESFLDSTYTLIKQIRIGCAGAYRIKFDMKASGATQGYGKIYRSGSPVGTERTTISTSYTTYSEDITGWGIDSTVELWAKNDNPSIASMYRNFRLYVTSSIETTVVQD